MSSFEKDVNARRAEQGLPLVDYDGDGPETWSDSTSDDDRVEQRRDEYSLSDPTPASDPTETTSPTTTTTDNDMSDRTGEYDPRRDVRNWDGDTTNAPDEGEPYVGFPDNFVGIEDGTGGVFVPGNGPTENTNPGGDDTVNDWNDVRESVTPGDGSDPSGGMALVLAVLASLVALVGLVRN